MSYGDSFVLRGQNLEGKTEGDVRRWRELRVEDHVVTRNRWKDPYPERTENVLSHTLIELRWEKHGSVSRTSVWATTSLCPLLEVIITKAPLTLLVSYYFSSRYRQNKRARQVPTAQHEEI